MAWSRVGVVKQLDLIYLLINLKGNGEERKETKIDSQVCGAMS